MSARSALAYRSSDNLHAPPTKPRLVLTTTSSRVTNLQILDDKALLMAYLGGNEHAFTEIYERYTARLVNFIWRLIGDREKAEDLMQEAFVRIERHARNFNFDKKFSSWVYAIASNLARNEHRDHTRRREVTFTAYQGNALEGDHPVEFEDFTLTPDKLSHKRHLRQLVEDAVAKLPENHREIFTLRELEGKTYGEIAEITDCNLGTVKSRLNRARTAFATIIEPWLD